MLSEDAVQETFLKIYKSIHLCPVSDLEKAWVYKIAVNTIRDMLRHISVRMKYLKIKPPLSVFASSPPEADIIALHTEIGRLPRKMKEVILLYYSDAAKIDGAGPVRTYFCIHLPAIPGEIGAAIGLDIVFMLRVYKESYLLFGAYPSEKTYLFQNYMNHQYTNMNLHYVAASAVFLIVFASILYSIVYFFLIRRSGLM